MGPLTPLTAGLASIIFAVAVVNIVNRAGVPNGSGRLSGRGKVLTFIVTFLVIFLVGAVVYFNTYYRATQEAVAFLDGNVNVKVAQDNGLTFYDGYGENALYIFYPGASVDTAAYAPLLSNIAERGVDCVAVDMPLHMAMLGRMKAAEVIEKYQYDEYYVGGHSLGGAMAEFFSSRYGMENGLKGFVGLAAYGTEPLPAGFRYLSIIGSEDKVINREGYDSAKELWPEGAVEYVIEGGNHSGFGLYGQQSGDGETALYGLEQIYITAMQTVDFIKEK